MSNTVAVISLKGGTGKTSLSIGAAAALSTPRRRVILIDSDPQGSATRWAEGGGLPFPVHALDASRGATHYRRDLEALSEGADLVLIDCPPEDGEPSNLAALVADLVLIPATPSALDLWAAGKAVQMAREARENRKGKLPLVSLIPSKLIARTRLAAELPGALKALGETVGPSIGQRVAVAEASVTGKPVAPSSPAGQELEELARHILNRLRRA